MKKKILTKNLLLTPFTFLVSFQLSIPFFINSIILCGFLSIGLILYKNRINSIKKIKAILLSSETFLLFFLFTLPFVYISISTIIQNAYDFSFFPRYFTTILHFISVLLFCCFVKEFNFTKNELFQSIFATIVIQAIIIILSFKFVDFLSFIRHFQFDSAISRLDLIGGAFARGLTLSGPLFFGLACSLGFTILCLSVYEFNNNNRIHIYMILLLLMIIFSLTARTVFIPYLCFGLYLIISSYKQSKIVFIKLSLIFFIILFLFFVFYMTSLQKILSDELIWTINNSFEFIFNYINNGSLSTSSTDHLNKMYFPIDENTLLVGDGIYTDLNTGSYYKETDAGYMRMTLLMGVPMSLLLLMFDSVLLYRVSKYLTNGNFDRIILYVIFLILFLTLQYKGDIWAYTFPLHSMVLIFYFMNRLSFFDYENK